MDKKLFHYMTIGFFFTAFAGTFCALGYPLSDHDLLVAMFCPVNNSPWESVKVIFFPSLLYFIIGWYFFCKTHPHFIRACFSGLLSGSFSFFPLFYTYSGILGKYNPYFTIAFLLTSAYLIYYFSYEFIIQKYVLLSMPILVCLLVSVLVCFFSFTFTPPFLPLFETLTS